MKLRKLAAFAFIIYALFYLLLFLQFPLNNSIGAHCDGLLAVTISNSMFNYLGCIFTGVHFTTSMFPVENIFQYGESSFGCLIIIMFFKLIGCSDIYSWYFFVVTLFALNGLGMFLVSYHFTKNFHASIIAGFFLTCSNFVFINIDDIHVFFYFLTFLAIFFLLKHKETQKNKFLLISSVLMGLQIYTSLYAFAYGSIIFVVVFIYSLNYFRKIKYKKIIIVACCATIYLIIIAPLILFYLRTKMSPNFFDPNDMWQGVVSLYTIKFSDLFKVMPNSLFYSSSFQESSILFEIRRSAFIGFLFMGISLFCVIRYFRKYFIWVLFVFIGLLLSTNIIYSLFPFLGVLRVPYRAYFITIIAFSILASIGIGSLFKKISTRKQLLITVVILSIHLIENIPYPFPLANFETVQQEALVKKDIKLGDGFCPINFIPNDKLSEAVNHIDKNSAVLCLPSKNIFGDKYTGSLTYSREIIYMIHQTYFKRNMFNGLNGYYPKTRVLLQSYIEELPKETSLQQLITSGMTHIIFYKNMVLTPQEDILKSLEDSNMLHLISESNDFALFEVVVKKSFPPNT